MLTIGAIWLALAVVVAVLFAAVGRSALHEEAALDRLLEAGAGRGDQPMAAATASPSARLQRPDPAEPSLAPHER